MIQYHDISPCIFHIFYSYNSLPSQHSNIAAGFWWPHLHCSALLQPEASPQGWGTGVPVWSTRFASMLGQPRLSFFSIALTIRRVPPIVPSKMTWPLPTKFLGPNVAMAAPHWAVTFSKCTANEPPVKAT